MMKTWTVNDVMTTAVVSVTGVTVYRELVDLLVGRHISAVPVVDEDLRVIGVVSEADLLRKIEYAGQEEPRVFERRRRRTDRAKSLARTAADMMSSPPVVVTAGTPIAAAARTMDAGQVKRLAVVDDAGRLVGIVTRGDLLKVHLRPDDGIRADVAVLAADACSEVDVAVTAGVVTLTGTVERRSTARLLVRLARQVPGVVHVVDELDYRLDDTAMSAAGTYYVVG